MNEEHLRFRQFSTRLPGQPASFAGRLLGFVGAIVVAVLAFMFSLAALAVVAVGVALLGGWLWWKTRAVRKQVREQMERQANLRPADGYIIEGEVVRRDQQPASDERRLD